MPVSSAPSQRVFTLPAGDWKVALVLRPYTTSEFLEFKRGRVKIKNGKVKENDTVGQRVRFVEKLMVDIYAIDPEGNRDIVTYPDESGQEMELGPKVPDWQKKVNVSWKNAVGIQLEGEECEEEDAVKN